MQKTCLLGFALIVLVVGCYGAPQEDLVTNLPSANFKVNFAHYSGYLQASSKHFFHYWFTESQGNPSSDPVILWLNGGPGCSSLGGLLTELGPFRAKDWGRTAFENPYAWNKIGSVLFIESPAGVGFSYSTDGGLSTSDDEVALDNYNALIYFYKWKFPELKKNDFYITGESYAGVYLPTLGVKLIQDKTNFPNFKGMAVGNGILHHQLNTNTLVPLFYNHALIRQTLWDQISSQCCDRNPSTCDYYHKVDQSRTCRSLIYTALNAYRGLDPYNLYAACYLPDDNKRSFVHQSIRRLTGKAAFQSPGFEPLHPDTKASVNTTFVPVCAQENATEVYLNRADVRQALHIPGFVDDWSDCNFIVNSEYNINYVNMADQVTAIANSGVRVLIYNGDTDSVCNGIMNKQFLALLNRDIIDDNSPLSNQHWSYNHEEPSIAGYVTKFQGGIDFVTVRGAGHFVPMDKPRESLQMLYNFIHQQPYSQATGINISPQPLING